MTIENRQRRIHPHGTPRPRFAEWAVRNNVKPTVSILSGVAQLLCLAALTASPATAARPTVILVQGTTSAPDVAEQNYAKTITRRISRWLTDAGVPHDIIGDEAVVAGALARAPVAVLCYNPHPGSRELRRLRDYIRGGGKLMVFYCQEPWLANVMGMRLGDYASSPLPGRWSAFRFVPTAPAGVPPCVFQESRNIRPVYPADSSAAAIAFWESADGTLLRDPAWVQSDAGVWMSHVLLEGDSTSKQQMLLALLGHYAPEVWRATAARQVGFLGMFGPFNTFQEACDYIGAQADVAGRRKLVQPSLDEAARLAATLPRLYDARCYPEAVEAGNGVRMLMLDAWSRLHEPRQGEFRAAWDPSGMGLYPRDWNRTCRILAASGIHAVFPNVVRGQVAHYESRILPRSEIAQYSGDQLAQCVAAAHRFGLQVHAWKICWSLDGAPPEFVTFFRRERRLQVSDDGETLNWLCPSHPANLDLELNVIREIAAFGVDGVHLDYIRYPDVHACYCAGCRKRFEAETGRAVRRWPEDLKSGPLKDAYRAWRCRRITDLVAAARKQLRETNPDIRLSAAVYGAYPGCASSMGQDWGEWLSAGYVDFVCPMDYTSSLDQFRALVRKQLALSQAGGRIFPGIGVTANESMLDPLQTLNQILVLRQENAAGFVLFALNRTIEKEILPFLSLGVTRPN